MSGAVHRGLDFYYLCCDNEAFGNTGFDGLLFWTDPGGKFIGECFRCDDVFLDKIGLGAQQVKLLHDDNQGDKGAQAADAGAEPMHDFEPHGNIGASAVKGFSMRPNESPITRPSVSIIEEEDHFIADPHVPRRLHALAGKRTTSHRTAVASNAPTGKAQQKLPPLPPSFRFGLRSSPVFETRVRELAECALPPAGGTKPTRRSRRSRRSGWTSPAGRTAA